MIAYTDDVISLYTSRECQQLLPPTMSNVYIAVPQNICTVYGGRCVLLVTLAHCHIRLLL